MGIKHGHTHIKDTAAVMHALMLNINFTCEEARGREVREVIIFNNCSVVNTRHIPNILDI